MPWKDKMAHLELCLTLLIMKRIKRDFLVTFILILHGVRIGGILSNKRHHRISDPVTFYEKEPHMHMSSRWCYVFLSTIC